MYFVQGCCLLINESVFFGAVSPELEEDLLKTVLKEFHVHSPFPMCAGSFSQILSPFSISKDE